MIQNWMLVLLIVISVVLHALGNIDRLAFMQAVDLIFSAVAFVGLLLLEATLQQVLLFLSASITCYFICFAIFTKWKSSRPVIKATQKEQDMQEEGNE